MKKREPIVLLTKEQKANSTAKIKEYLKDNFEIEAGNLQTEMFLDYITENIGIYYYNRAVADSMAFVSDKVEDLYLLMKDEE